MLTLIGIGIWDAKDISLRALEELREADLAYAESYTRESYHAQQVFKELEKLSGTKIKVVAREFVESDLGEIIEEAKKGDVVFLTFGDPGIATTHISLLLAAAKAGIGTKIIHGSSIISAAIGASGLQIYKFGKIITIPKWSENYKPKSFLETLKFNQKNGLHTLFLLEMSDPKEALQQIGKGSAVVLTKVGSEEQKIVFGQISKLMKQKLGDGPAVIIVPGKLHFMEKEALDRFKLE